MQALMAPFAKHRQVNETVADSLFKHLRRG
jgi:hypothetical protein